jgi:hypothetical protein
MADLTPYEIASEKVDLSMNWGLSALDYVYTDYDRATARFNKLNVDFQTLMICVGARRAAVVENEIRPMSTRMRSRNDYLSSLSGILAALTTAQASFSGDDSGTTETTVNLTDGQVSMLNTINGANGLVYKKTDGKYYTTKAKCEGAVQAVKGEMDKENNSSQTDMTRLQSLVDARDDSYSTTTNIMSAISDTRSNLIGNLSS